MRSHLSTGDCRGEEKRGWGGGGGEGEKGDEGVEREKERERETGGCDMISPLPTV